MGWSTLWGLTHPHWVNEATQPSYPVSPPSPALNLSQHQGLFQWVSLFLFQHFWLMAVYHSVMILVLHQEEGEHPSTLPSWDQSLLHIFLTCLVCVAPQTHLKTQSLLTQQQSLFSIIFRPCLCSPLSAKNVLSFIFIWVTFALNI